MHGQQNIKICAYPVFSRDKQQDVYIALRRQLFCYFKVVSYQNTILKLRFSLLCESQSFLRALAIELQLYAMNFKNADRFGEILQRALCKMWKDNSNMPALITVLREIINCYHSRTGETEQWFVTSCCSRKRETIVAVH